MRRYIVEIYLGEDLIRQEVVWALHHNDAMDKATTLFYEPDQPNQEIRVAAVEENPL